MRQISRREFLRRFGTVVGAAVLMRKIPLPDEPIASLPEYEYHPADVDFTYEPEPFWYSFRAESNDLPDVREWFIQCANLIYDAGKDIPQSRREIQCYLPPKLNYDLDFTNRFSADWYDGDCRFGFVIKWHDWDRWPTPQEILAMALPMLHSEPDIGPRDLWLPNPRAIWVNA